MFFKKKLSVYQLENINNLLKQVTESADLVNSTTKPDIFFKRLNLLLDRLMELAQYEKYRAFKGTLPTRQMQSILENLDKTVDAFITRAYETELEAAAKLKTDKGKEGRMSKFYERMLSAFDSSHTFWTGSYTRSGPMPHYTGELYRKENYERLVQMHNTFMGTMET